MGFSFRLHAAQVSSANAYLNVHFLTKTIWALSSVADTNQKKTLWFHGHRWIRLHRVIDITELLLLSTDYLYT